MTKIIPRNLFVLSLIVLINSLISPSSGLISDKRLCYDEKCSEPISLANTLSKYYTNDKAILSFKANADVKVFSKSAGKRLDLWGVEIDGKRGYVPKNFIREFKLLQTKLTFEVPTESVEEILNVEILQRPENDVIKEETSENLSEAPVTDRTEMPDELKSHYLDKTGEEKPEASVIDSSTKNIEHSVPIPENVSPSYEIVDGTTIPLAPNEPPSDFLFQSPDETTDDKEPVLSLHPHPSLVSSTLSFVSKVFDRVTEPFERTKQENDEVISGSENSKLSDETEKENNETPKEEDLRIENLRNEFKVEGTKVDETFLPKSEHQVQSQINKAGKELEFVDTTIENEVSEEISEEKDNEDINEDYVGEDDSGQDEEDDEEEGEESEEEIPQNVMIPGEKAEVVNSEKDESKSVPQSLEHSKLEMKSNPKKDIINKEVPVEDSSIGEKFIPEKVSLSEIISVKGNNDSNSSVDEVTNQVPFLNAQSSKGVFNSNENVTILENKNENRDIKAESVVPEAQNLSEESRNVTNEISEKEVLSNEMQKLETVSIEAVEKNVHIVDSNSSVNNKSDIDAESFQTTKIDNFIEHELGSIQNVVISSEKDVVLNQNDIISISKNDSSIFESLEPHFHEEVVPHTNQQILAAEQVSNLNEFPSNRNLLNIVEEAQYDSQNSQIDKVSISEINQIGISTTTLSEEITDSEKKPLVGSLFTESDVGKEESVMHPSSVLPAQVCERDFDCLIENSHHEDDTAVTYAMKTGRNYWEFLVYVGMTSVTILIFTLGYYYIENARRDSQLIAKINKLEKELMVSTKESVLLNENLTSTKTKLNSIEDESFGSNEMVASLKTDLEASENARLELEDQVVTLEKELESATEAGLELEKMLREFLSSNNEDNPLAQSIEDLQSRLNSQHTEIESLKNALNLKKQENEGLSSDLLSSVKKCEEYEMEIRRLGEELETQGNMKIYIEQTLEDKIQRLEMKVIEMTEERSQLRKDFKAREIEVQNLLEILDRENSNNVDFDKLYNAIQAKAEALQLVEERNELQMKLKEMENSHQLLEDHVKYAKGEVVQLTEQCRAFEKEKKDTETKLEVLSNFFKEKEAQRQKEESAWLQKQGEVSSTVKRIHTMQNEIQNYKQQIEILKREIVDQEREYKSQISALETKAHEHWVVARQNERRLEELKTESGQLRNRLTLVEKNMNDTEPDVKLHRLEANGETATSPSMFLGADTSSSPIMFSNTSGVPPPPPSYMFGPSFHPYLPPPPPPSGPGGIPPFDVGQRPPPLGGRLSSPPPLPLQPSLSSRYENAGSPPPLSPPLPHHYGRHRSPPPPFSNDRIHPPPLPPSSLLPIPPIGISHAWGGESLPPLRPPSFHPHQRDQRARNHKGSLHSSGESLDKSHHSDKV